MLSFGHFASLTIPPSHHSAVRRWLGTGPYWLGQLLLWVPLSLGSDFVLTLARGHSLDWHSVVSSLAFALEMIVGTHLSRGILLSLRRRPRSARFLILAGCACLPLCAVVAAGLGLLLSRLLYGAEAFVLENLFHNTFSLAYVATEYSAFWIAGYVALTFLHGLHLAETARLRSEAAAKEAELGAIKAQINPHFLFNSLNTLRALLPREQAVPREAITMLADLLRAALTVQASPSIPLHQELATVDAYLALEQLRFEERLRVRRSIAPDCLAHPVPPFALQTLVENAVKFGIGSRSAGGEIGITIAAHPGHLLLQVTNPGRIAASSDSTGLGLRNTRRRLEHLFGDRARLTLVQSEPDLVTAELRLPSSAA